MRIADALSGVKRLYVETSPLIYYIEENPAFIGHMDQILALMIQMPIQGICSVITLTEVLPIPLRAKNAALVAAYRRILLKNREFQCVAIDAHTAERAAQLRGAHNLKTPDALHIATAIIMRCDAFLTNDLDLRRITDVRVLILDELELDPPQAADA